MTEGKRQKGRQRSWLWALGGGWIFLARPLAAALPEAYIAAWQALQEGDPARAEACLEPALPHLPNPAHAALLLFWARCQQGQFEAALRGLCQARETYREHSFADSLVAFYTHRLTEDHLRRRARMPREKSELAFYLGAYRQDYEGNPQAAFRLYQRCVDLGQRNTPEFALAQAELARRRPGRAAPAAVWRWKPARLPGTSLRLYRPPDWSVELQPNFLALIAPEGQTKILASYWAGRNHILSSLEMTAARNGTHIERSGPVDLRWAGLACQAWKVEGQPAQRKVRQVILAVAWNQGFLLFLYEASPSDFLWRQATFDALLQGLGNSPPPFPKLR